MQRNIEALDIVCKHFTEYRSDDVVELRNEIRRLKQEILRLRISLVINRALVGQWLNYQRVQSIEL